MAGRVVSPYFVGRHAQMDQLHEAALLASKGQGSLLLVAGDAGVGKTRLIEEFSLRAQESGILVAIGGCVDLGGTGVPYAPVIELLRDLVGHLGAAALADAAGPIPAELAPLVMSCLPLQTPMEAPPYELAQGRLFELLLAMFIRLGETVPFCAVLEDIQWADASTRGLVMFLARNLRRSRAMVVCTYRLDDLYRRHPLRPVLAELSRAGVCQLRLAGFDRVELATQLRSISGSDPSPEMVEEVLVRSEGNPFYAEELFAALQAGERGLPALLRDVILSRIEQLEEPTQTALQALSVAGRRASHGLLARVTAMTDDDLDDALAAALAAQLLIAVAPDGYCFRHALVKEAVEEDLLTGRRRRLHREIAEILTERPALACDDRSMIAAMLAHHWQEAGEAARSLEASMTAARTADAMAAPAAALAHYERAMSLWPQVEDPVGLAGADLVDVTMAAADAAFRIGDARKAMGLSQAAMELIDRLHDSVRAALIRERLARFNWLAGDSESALSMYGESVALFADEETASRSHARVLAAYGQALMLMSRGSEAVAQCQHAIAIARLVGDRSVEGHALNTLGYALQGTDRWREGLSNLRAALHIAEEIGDSDNLLRAYNNLSDALGHSGGELEEAAELALAGVAMARRLGCMSGVGSLLKSWAVHVLVCLGRLSEAAVLLDDLDASAGQGIVRIEAHLASAMFAQVTGDLRAAQNAVCAAFANATPGLHCKQRWFVLERAAAVALDDGRFDEARRLVAEAVGLGSEAGDAEIVILAAAQGIRVEAEAARVGHRDALTEARAAGLQNKARRAANGIGAGGDGLNPMLDARLALAEAEVVDLARHPSSERWAVAVARLDRVGLVVEAIRARLRHAEAILNANGPRDDACRVVEEAYRGAQRAGAVPLVHEAERLAQRARLTLAHHDEADVATDLDLARFGLTQREVEVLRHVCAGRTNRQIARSLFISEKTASVHVSNLIRKLGVTNRIEVGAIGQRHGVYHLPE